MTGLALNADYGDNIIMDVSAATTDNPADCVSATDATAVAGDIVIGCWIGILAAPFGVAVDRAVDPGCARHHVQEPYFCLSLCHVFICLFHVSLINFWCNIILSRDS